MTYAQPDLLDLPPARRTCEMCGRRLRDPESRQRGCGPKCWAKTHTAPRRGRWVMVWIPYTAVPVADDQPDLFDDEGQP